jgi:hypothetical protein
VYLNGGLLARNQCASGWFCDRSTRSRCYVHFLGSTANAQSVPKTHAALRTSHAALPALSKFRHNGAPRHKISSSWCPQTQNSTSAAHYQQSTAITLLSLLCKVLPRHQPSFSRRTSGRTLLMRVLFVFQEQHEPLGTVPRQDIAVRAVQRG